MARDITVFFDDGTEHVYKGAPDDVTPDAVHQRAAKEFGKAVKSLDGGRNPARQRLPEGVAPSTAGGGRGTGPGGPSAVEMAGEAARRSVRQDAAADQIAAPQQLGASPEDFSAPAIESEKPVEVKQSPPSLTPLRDYRRDSERDYQRDYRQEALDEAVNFIDEGVAAEKVYEQFGKIGLGRADIEQHGLARGSDFFKGTTGKTAGTVRSAGGEIQPTPTPDRSMFAVVNDTMINTANAAAAIGKTVPDLMNPGSGAGKRIDKFVKDGQRAQSEWQKAKREKLAESLSSTDGEVDKAGAYLYHAIVEDPLSTLSEAAGNVGPFALVGKAMAGLKAGQITAGSMAVAGAAGAGEVRGNIWEAISTKRDADLMKISPEYKQLRAGGMDEDAAKREIGANLVRNLPELIAVGAVSALGGKFGLEAIATGAKISTGRLSAGLIGLVDEGSQGAIEQLATNLAINRAVPGQKLTEDVLMNAVAEGLVGGVSGVVAGGRNFAAEMKYQHARELGLNVNPPMVTDTPDAQHSKTVGVFKAVAAKYGIDPAAVKRAMEAVEGMPADDVGPFLQRLAGVLAKKTAETGVPLIRRPLDPHAVDVLGAGPMEETPEVEERQAEIPVEKAAKAPATPGMPNEEAEGRMLARIEALAKKDRDGLREWEKTAAPAGADGRKRALAGADGPVESVEATETDIMTKAGNPFATERSAQRALKDHPGASIVPVEGGFVVRKPAPAKAATKPAPEPEPTAPTEQTADAIEQDPLYAEFEQLVRETAMAEKESDPADWTKQQRAAYERGDWRTFSKLRGYTEAEIGQYGKYMDVANGLIDKYGPDLVHEADAMLRGGVTGPVESAKPVDRAPVAPTATTRPQPTAMGATLPAQPRGTRGTGAADVVKTPDAKAPTKEAAKPEAPADDLDAMFDDLMAEKAPAAERPSVVAVPEAVSVAIAEQMNKQKARIRRLNAEAKAPGMNMEDKAATLTKIKAAEATLRKMRTSVFDAEDAAVRAVETNDAEAFAEHSDLFPTAGAALREMLAQPEVTSSNQPLSDAETKDLERMLGHAGAVSTKDMGGHWMAEATGGGLRNPVRARGTTKDAAKRNLLGNVRDARAAQEQGAAPPRTAKPPKGKPESKLDELRSYFTPGNVVKGYSGFHEVLAFKINPDGGFDVDVHEVRETTANNWARVGKPRDARRHSTVPDAKDLKAGPVARLPALPGAEVVYTEPRADGAPFPNAPDRGAKPETKDKIVGRRADGVMIREDERGVRFYSEGGFRIFETVSTRPTRDGVRVGRSTLKPEFMTAEESGAEAPRTATAAAASAAVNVGSALGNAIDGLGALFAPGKGTFGSGPVFNEDTYAKAKPLFQAALVNLKDAAADLRAAMSTIIDMVTAKFGREAALNMKPYIVRFVQDVRDGNTEVQDGNATRELDQPGQGALEGASSEDVRPPEQAGEPGQGADERGDGDGGGTESADRPGDGPAGGMGADARDVPVPAPRTRKRAKKQADPGLFGPSGTDAGPELVRPERGGLSEENPAPNGPAIPAPQPVEDFTIEDDLGLGEGGEKTKYRGNVEAIRLLRDLDATGRLAAPSEQRVLAKYVGWGGVSGVFDAEHKNWTKEHQELKALLTQEEWDAAARSSRYAHYTSKEIIVDGIYAALRRFGFTGGKTLEAGAAVGNFLGLMPADMRSAGRFTAIEREPFSSAIARHLYPKQNVQKADFTEFKGQDGYFDASVGNPPFAEDPQTDLSGRKHLSGLTLHNYFFAKAVDMLREGGLMGQVITNSFMDAKTETARRYIGERTRFLGAIRLPNNAFSKNANTQVTTDIVFLQKLPDNEIGSKAAKEDAKRWRETVLYDDKNGKQVALNRYFAENPEMMLGEFGAFGTMYRPDMPALVARPGQDTLALLRAAVERLPANVYQSLADTGTDDHLKAAVLALKAPPVREGGYYVDGDRLIQRLTDIAGEPRGVEITAETQWTEKTKLGPQGYERIKALAAMRGTVRGLIAAEMADDDRGMGELRATLNQQYDAYAEQHGLLNDPGTLRVFDDDPDYPLLASLESNYNAGIGKAAAKRMGIKPVPATADKSAIFSRRVVAARTAVRKVDTPIDALAVSMAERGKLDTAYIGELLGMEPEAVLKALSTGEKPALFLDPATREYVLRDAYLSGNVRAKLAQAKEAGMVENARALEAVQPEDVGAHEITARIGSPWVPESVYEDFAVSLFGEGSTARVRYLKLNSSYQFNVSGASEVALNNTWGTAKMSGDSILAALLNNKPVKITYLDGDKKLRTDVEGTDAANAKAQDIKDRFGDWLFKDADRAEILVRAYNDTNNNYVTRVYDGSMMTFPGKVPDEIIRFRRHQRNAIARTVQDRTALYDHVVGAGKTYTVIASAMELKRTGLAKKPMIVVPNHLVKQWAADFYRLYPGANILTATKKDFLRENRRKFLAKIATGDWDAVVIAHSSFGFIKPAPEFEAEFNSKQIADIVATIKQVKDDDGEKMQKKRTVKQLEGLKERLENRIKALRDKPMDDLLDFQQIGVDQMFVDEFHMFKNLMFSTKMQNVQGLGDSAGSQRAYDMLVKINQIYAQNGRGQGFVAATGTPVSNSLAEMYHMMRYLMPDAMQAQNFGSFDAWANTFASVEQVWMQKPSGDGFKASSRMSNFVNTPELLKMFDQVADTVTQDDIKVAYREENDGAEFPLPPLKTGRRQPVSLDKSPAQNAYMEEIAKRAKVLESKKGPPKKGEDNTLVIMGDARKAAMDIRLVDPDVTEREPGGRIDRAAQEITARYQQYNDVLGTQVVFSDLGTPLSRAKAEMKEYEELRERIEAATDDVRADAALGSESAKAKVEDAEDAQAELDAMGADWLGSVKAAMRGFSVYDDLRKALVERGIPEKEIAFIHEYNTDDQKAGLFKKVNAGQIRVLIGSTAKMGAGTNVQERLVAEHHLDVPWRPSDVEQREGRIIRQGNSFVHVPGKVAGIPGFEVEILAYVTKDTLDMRMWQIQETKLKMINQLRSRKVAREIDNAFEDMEMSAGEMQAAATGNVDLLKEIQLRTDVKKLEQRQRSFDAQANDLKSRRARAERLAQTAPAEVKKWTPWAAAAAAWSATRAEPRAISVKINGTEYTDRAAAGEELRRLLDAHQAKLDARKDAQEAAKVTAKMEFPGEDGESAAKRMNAADAFTKANPMPKLAVNLSGTEYNSKVSLAEAYTELTGDATRFDWQFGGKAYVHRQKAAADMADVVAEAVSTETEQQIGAFGPFTVSVEGMTSRVSGPRLDVMVRHDGKTISDDINVQANNPKQDAFNAIERAQQLVAGARSQLMFAQSDAERAQKALAELGAVQEAGEWPDRPKLDAARAAHKEVLARLAAKKAEPDDGDATESLSIADAEAPPFYSELARQIGALPMKAGDAAAWQQAIKGMLGKGVKADEVEWTGLGEWLDTQTGKIPKAAVQEFLNANGVQVTETVLEGGANYKSGELDSVLEQWAARNTGPVSDAILHGEPWNTTRRLAEKHNEPDVVRMIDRGEDRTRYAQYTLPGGTNAREITFQIVSPKVEAYTDPHWDHPTDIWVRTTDRVDAEGNHVLFVEEIQSGRAQAGKKYGFAGQDENAAEREAIKKQMVALVDQRATIRKNDDGSLTVAQQGEQLRAITAQLEAMDARMRQIPVPGNQPPPAPFVGKTDAWVALALKRVIKMAVDEGYDRVAFVNGEQSAERYDLSKQVDRIEASPGKDYAEGVYDLDIWPTDGAKLKKHGLSAGDVEDLIGKEMAARITKAVDAWREKHLVYRGELGKTGISESRLDELRYARDAIETDFEGDGLKVGGEGMKAFYDKIVPSVAKDVLKKMGGGALESVRISTPDSTRTVYNGADFMEDENRAEPDFDTEDVPAATLTQPGFTITPAMREKAAGGLPMFDLDGKKSQEDTSAYAPATDQHQQWAAEANRRMAKQFGTRLGLFRAVDGLSETAGRAGDRLQAKMRKAVSVTAKRLFDTEVVFVKFQPGRSLFNGSTSSAIPGVVFINVEAQKPMMAVLGHELLHRLRMSNEGLYQRLAQRLDKLTKGENRYRDALEQKYLDAGADFSKVKVQEEFYADITGDFFTDAQFWKDLQADRPTLFQRVANAIVKFLDDVAQKIAGFRPYGTEQYLTDIKAARAAVASAMKDFSSLRVSQADKSEGGIVMSVAEDQTATPAFRRWFGDSKVVDAGGKPLVVYHGTRDDIAAFDGGRIKARFPNSEGFYFTSRPSHASAYADSINNAAEDFNPASKFIKPVAEGANVMPAYVSLQNPKIINVSEWGTLESSVDADGGARVRAARAAGHDGVIVKREADDDWSGVMVIAFRPEQIKSAIGNRGTFDPADPDIRMSIADQDARSPSFARRIVQTAHDMLDTPEKFNWWHKSIGTQFHKAKINAVFRRVYEAGQDFMHDTAAFANRAADMAPNLLPSLDRFSDLFKRLALTGADQRAVAQAAFEGTLEGKIWTKAEMTARGMTEHQQMLYQQMRRSIDKSLDILVAAEVSRIMGDEASDLKGLIQTDDLGEFRQRAKDRINALRDEADDALAMLKKRHKKEAADLEKAQDAEAKIPANTRPPTQSLMQDRHADARNGMKLRQGGERYRAEQELAKWEQMEFDVADNYEKITNLKEQGYAPLMRFGRYTVTVMGEDEDGNPATKFFGMYENRVEMNRAAREAREDYPEATSVETGVVDPGAWKAFRGVSPETLAIFGSAAKLDKSSEAYQDYLRLATANHSALKRLIHRKGTPGFSKDPTRVLAAFVTSNARRSSQLLHFGELQNAAEAARKSRAGDVSAEARKLAEAIQDSPEDGELTAAIKGLGFTMYLGGSVASAAVNMTQTVTTTLPYLSSFSNPATATARIGSAMTMLSTGAIKSNSDLGIALKRADDEGITSPQEMHQLQAEATRNLVDMLPAVARTTTKRLSFAWGSLFSYAEQINRRIAFVAAYNTAAAMSPTQLKAAASRAGINEATPFAFAANAVDETQFVYNKGSFSNWARNPVGSVLLMFKTYPVSYLELFMRMPRREKGLMLLMLFMVAGAGGLPFADNLDDLIDSVGQRMGYDTNAKNWRKKVMEEHLGPQVAAFMEKGLTGIAGSPIDVSGRLGMGAPIPATGLMRKDVLNAEREVFELAGPMGSYMNSLLETARGDGHKALPVAIQNAIKAADMLRTGTYRDTKNRTVIKTNTADAAVKAIGFQPGVVAKSQFESRLQAQRQALQRLVEREIASDIAEGIFSKKPEMKNDALARLRKWNKTNPDTRIEITEAQIESRLENMAMTRAQRLQKASPREMRGQ